MDFDSSLMVELEVLNALLGVLAAEGKLQCFWQAWKKKTTTKNLRHDMQVNHRLLLFLYNFVVVDV